MSAVLSGLLNLGAFITLAWLFVTRRSAAVDSAFAAAKAPARPAAGFAPLAAQPGSAAALSAGKSGFSATSASPPMSPPGTSTTDRLYVYPHVEDDYVTDAEEGGCPRVSDAEPLSSPPTTHAMERAELIASLGDGLAAANETAKERPPSGKSDLSGRGARLAWDENGGYAEA